jgi:hypothetical protein
MILGGDDRAHGIAGGATLDDLFRRAGIRDPDALALVDPPNRAAFTGGAPRALTFAEADRAISAFAARLHELGLYSDTVVAIQLPNTVESVIALLGVLRAGMIAAPIPLLWRQRDMIDALGQVGARAIVTTPRIGDWRHTDIAMQVAAELFPIRYVCGFGGDLDDGVVPLDDIFAPARRDTPPRGGKEGSAAAHVAVVTYDRAGDGLLPVARNHLEMTAGGLSVFLESGLRPGAPILSTIPLGSFAGLSLTLLPWLLNAGALHLHHGFDAAAFAAQCGALGGGMVVVPAPALTPIAQTGALETADAVAALWRAPERMASGVLWHGAAALIDVASFGEFGLVASRRAGDGMARPMPYGPVQNPCGAPGAVAGIETARTKTGTLALRGPMVPGIAFPASAGVPDFPVDDAGFVDTGFPCQVDRAARTLAISGPPGGFAGIGYYRFRQRDLDVDIADADPGGTIVALPDAMLGQRLAGSAPDRAALRRELQARGLNPLVARAFRAGEPNAA